MTKAKNMKGQKIGRLFIFEYVGIKNTHAQWKALCDCGNFKIVDGGEVRRGAIVSCGCWGKERLKLGPETVRKHGMHGSETYNSWAHMMQRCKNPNNDRYHRYGGRTITVCDRWKLFENFVADMGMRPPGMSIDRINNSGNYEPSNCRWATPSEQSNNMDHNIRVMFQGEIKTLSEISLLTGIKKSTLYARLKRNWPTDKLFDPPEK